MDPRDYRDARWHALLRAAEELGVPEEHAEAVVDRVLAAQVRRIRRADDPDPLVREALEREVGGPPSRAVPRRPWPAVIAVAEAVLLAVAVGTVTRPAPRPVDRLDADQVPSFFGYDRDHARAALTERGLRVRVEPFRSCEVMDRVVATDPPPGRPFRPGERIVLYTAVPSSITCLTDYQDRSTAWQLLDFANGRGPAPAFASRVFVYPGDGLRIVLTRADRRESWAATGVLSALRRASADVARTTERPLTYAVPALRVVEPDQGTGRCGVPSRAVAGTANAVAVLVRPADRRGCGLRVEIYRDQDGLIDGLALYRPPS